MPETRLRALEERVTHLDERLSLSMNRNLCHLEVLREVTEALRLSVEVNTHTCSALKACERLLQSIERAHD